MILLALLGYNLDKVAISLLITAKTLQLCFMLVLSNISEVIAFSLEHMKLSACFTVYIF